MHQGMVMFRVEKGLDPPVSAEQAKRIEDGLQVCDWNLIRALPGDDLKNAAGQAGARMGAHAIVHLDKVQLVVVLTTTFVAGGSNANSQAKFTAGLKELVKQVVVRPVLDQRVAKLLNKDD